MIVEFEVSRPFQAKPGKYRSTRMRRWWWLWFAVAITKGDAYDRTMGAWEDRTRR